MTERVNGATTAPVIIKLLMMHTRLGKHQLGENKYRLHIGFKLHGIS